MRAPEAVNVLAGTPGWEKELRPFDWRLPGSINGVMVGGKLRE
ncbi:hypothetical protein ACFXPQ_12505 [Streptomyces lydicus]